MLQKKGEVALISRICLDAARRIAMLRKEVAIHASSNYHGTSYESAMLNMGTLTWDGALGGTLASAMSVNGAPAGIATCHHLETRTWDQTHQAIFPQKTTPENIHSV